MVQLEPAFPQGFVADLPDLGISKVRHERPIFINRDLRLTPQPQLNVQQNLSSKIGGFLGIGKTLSKSQIVLDKDIYSVGDTIRVQINCDNSECSKSISGFKLKLQRNIQAVSEMGETKVANHQKYVSIFKETEGVAAHENKQIQIELEIPEMDDYNPSFPNID